MALSFLTGINLNRNELQNARIQTLGTPPSSPLNGLIYYDTTTNRFMGYANGWVDLGAVYDGEQFTTALKNKLNGIATNATRVEKSNTNGNVKINGAETIVYTHPGSGTNPHKTTKADIGLSNAENKSAAMILNELTSAKIVEKLGFMPKQIDVGVDVSKGTATGSKKIYIATDTKKIWLDNANGNWIQIGGQDTISWSNITGKPSTFTPPIATSTRLGGIKVGDNLTISADGTLSAAADPAKFIIKEQRYTAIEGQKDFVLTNGTYNPGVGSLEVFLNGAKLESDILKETGTNKFSLKLPLSAGDILLARYIQLINAEPYPVHASEHLQSGSDPIPLATSSQAGLMAGTDKAKLTDTYTKSETVNAISAAVNKLINGAPGALDTLQELAKAMGDDPNFSATITNKLATKVDKVSGKVLTTNDFTTELLNKLNGIEAGANRYIHPNAHGASMITQDSAHRFVSDSEKATWNARAKKYVTNIGDGSKTSFTVTHNLGTQDVGVTVRESASPYSIVYCDCQITNTNAITLLFSSAPKLNQYKVVVVG